MRCDDQRQGNAASSARAARELLETIDRPALKALPSEPYRYAEWKRCSRRARLSRRDRPIITTRCRSRLIREIVEARITGATVEVFHKGIRVASHLRSQPCVTGTRRSPEHMPSAHRRYAEWTPANA